MFEYVGRVRFGPDRALLDCSGSCNGDNNEECRREPGSIKTTSLSRL